MTLRTLFVYLEAVLLMMTVMEMNIVMKMFVRQAVEVMRAVMQLPVPDVLIISARY